MFISTLYFTPKFDNVNQTMTFTIYKNGVNVYTSVLTATTPPVPTTYQSLVDQNKSIDFAKGDFYYATLSVNDYDPPNPANGASFTATLGFY